MWAHVARVLTRDRACLRGSVAMVLAAVAVVPLAACASAGGTHTSARSSPSPSDSNPAVTATSGVGASGPSVTRQSGSRSGAAPTGNIHQTVHARTVITKPPVPLHAVADFGTGVTARITSIAALSVQAVGPGEVSGPGLRLVITVRNGTAKAITLDNAVVTVTDAQGTPGVPMEWTPQTSDDDANHPDPINFSHPMQGSLAGHHEVSGTYVFTLPAGHRNSVIVNVSYAGDAPVVLFRGNAG